MPEEEEESVQDSGESDSKEQAVEDSSDGGGETGTVKEAAPEEGADESEEAVTDEKSDAAESDSDEADADLTEDQDFETEPGVSDTEAAAEATTAAAEELPATRTEYTYSDSNVSVKVTLQKADAVPDDADLVVTRVTDRTDGYNYDAYMDALNDQAEDGKEYTSDNTLLYDIAFMYEEKDAEGNGTGKVIEVLHGLHLELTFQLTADGEAVEGKTLKLNADKTRATRSHLIPSSRSMRPAR